MSAAVEITAVVGVRKQRWMLPGLPGKSFAASRNESACERRFGGRGSGGSRAIGPERQLAAHESRRAEARLRSYGDNDPEQRWVAIEARSAFEAAINYWGTMAALMGPAGVPRPTPETIFQVRIDGRVYRVQAWRALAWANEVAERRMRAEEQRRR